MRIVKGALIFLLVAAASSVAATFAQTSGGPPDRHDVGDPPRCPTITVSCPDTSGPSDRLIFTANLSGGDPNVTPTFRWRVSAGEITGGQGTHTITVDASNALGQFVTATLDVGGYERDQPSCPMSASCTIGPGDPPVARKLDEYGDMRIGEEKLRLDNFAAELRNDPTARGFFVCYGGRRGGAGEARRRCHRARGYLVDMRGIGAPRVVTADGGSREQPAVELWVVPPGAEPPSGAPLTMPEPKAGASKRRPPRRRVRH